MTSTTARPGAGPTGRRLEVLEMLQSSPSPLSILDIADRLGVHPNTVRFHLDVLTDSGRVERVESTRVTPGRPPQLFRAHRGMDPDGPRSYQSLAGVLAAGLGTGPAATDQAIDTGRAWGSRLGAAASTESESDRTGSDDEAIDRLVAILDDLGFAPRRSDSTTESQIALANCPFLDLIEDHGSVICPLHLGLMQGVLTALDAGVSVERLDPFVQPDLCLAHVGPADPAGTGATR